MSARRAFLVFSGVVVASSLLLAAGTTGSKDPQAVAILSQALTAATGGSTIGPISDFIATGTITYYWAAPAVQGTATVKGRAPDQFRLDAVIPDGTRSFVVSHGVGGLKDTSGTVTTIPYHNTVNLGILSFPYPGISARLADPLATISDLGLVTNDAGVQLHQIHIQRGFPPSSDPNGTLASLCGTDYFLDPQTGLVVQVVDQTHPIQTLTKSYAHEIDLGGYMSVNGIQVPMTVAEKVGGQTIWQVQISNISFNVGLTDADFVLQ